MKRALCGFLCVLILTLMGTTAWGQVRVMVGPGVVSLADESLASVDWRLTADVQFWKSLGARVWLRIDRELGLGWGLGPLFRLGQVSFTLGLQSLFDAFFLVGGVGIEFGLGRAGPIRFQFFNDLDFALSLTGDDILPSLFQYHVGLTLAF